MDDEELPEGETVEMDMDYRKISQYWYIRTY